MDTVASTIAQPYSVVLVAIDGDHTGSTTSFFGQRQGTGNNSVFQGADPNNTWRILSPTALTAATNSRDSAWHYFTLIFDGTNSKIREDGVEVASGDSGANGFDGMTIFNFQGGTQPALAGTRIAHIGVYNVNIGTTGTIQADAESGLKTEYGFV